LLTLLCTPSSLSQEAGTALGAQAGEARLREIVTSAGFVTLRRVAETPFNIVLEARGLTWPQRPGRAQTRPGRPPLPARGGIASCEQRVENSGRPETWGFAAFLAGISDGALTFRNLDLLRAGA